MNFQMYVPTKILFGCGALGRLHEQELPGKKALVVISRGRSVHTHGYLERLLKELALAGVSYALFDRIQPNPVREAVMEGAACARAQDCDFIIALGGGSCIDSAKAIAVMAVHDGDIWDYMNGGTGGGRPVTEKPLPVVAVSTTAGTGSEADAGSVISNPITREKLVIKSPLLFPALCIEDPELMVSVPPLLTACQGFDAFSHAVEGYLSRMANPMSDMYAITAIENVARHLPRAVRDGGDLDARTHIAFGNLLSGTVMCVGTLTSQHSMEHALSAYHESLPHGAGLIMLSRAYFGNLVREHACDERFIRMAAAMGYPGASRPEDFLLALQALLEACGVAELSMHAYGIRAGEFDSMADSAMGPMGPQFAFDRVRLEKRDVVRIYQESYRK